MREDLFDSLSFDGHAARSPLAEANTMAMSRAVETELVARQFEFERRARKVREERADLLSIECLGRSPVTETKSRGGTGFVAQILTGGQFAESRASTSELTAQVFRRIRQGVAAFPLIQVRRRTVITMYGFEQFNGIGEQDRTFGRLSTADGRVVRAEQFVFIQAHLSGRFAGEATTED